MMLKRFGRYSPRRGSPVRWVAPSSFRWSRKIVNRFAPLRTTLNRRSERTAISVSINGVAATADDPEEQLVMTKNMPAPRRAGTAKNSAKARALRALNSIAGDAGALELVADVVDELAKRSRHRRR